MYKEIGSLHLVHVTCEPTENKSNSMPQRAPTQEIRHILSLRKQRCTLFKHFTLVGNFDISATDASGLVFALAYTNFETTNASLIELF